MPPSKRKAAEVMCQNEGAREALQGQGERVLQVVLETCRRPAQLAEWVATPLESAAARKDESLSRKLAALRDRKRGAHGAMRGEGEKMLTLVLQTTDPTRLTEWLSALLEGAAAQADESLCEKLVEAGAKVGDVALFRAIRGGSVAVVDLLLENGASVDYYADSGPLEDRVDEWEGEGPLGYVAKYGNVEIAQSMMRKGAFPDDEEGHSASPLIYAIEKGDVAMVEAFLDNGVDINRRYGEFCWSTLDCAAVSDAEESLDILRMIISHGNHAADVNSAGGYGGQTALHKAAKANRPGAVRLLVEAGARINIVACVEEWSMITSTSLEDATPLHAAAGGLAAEAALALLGCGADVNAKAKRGRTALHIAAAIAAHEDAVRVVDLLLRWDADEKAVCGSGKTPEDVVGTERVSRFNFPGNVERVRSLLARAPADRAWRRRGFLVLCRVHRDRVRLGSDMASLAAAVLGLVEDGVFRRIVGYL